MIRHALGHYINLDDSEVNRAAAINASTTNDNEVATMYPNLVHGGGEQKTLHLDDMVSVSTIYPDASFASGFGQITGSTLLSMGPALSDVTTVAACVLAQHACRADQLFERQAPRWQELTNRGQVPQALRDGLACLPVHAGAGQGVGNPGGKDVVRCAVAITRAGARFVAKKQRSLQKCIDRLFACEQTEQDNPKCPTDARTACVKVFERIGVAEQNLVVAIAKACPAALYTTMRDALGANLTVLGPEYARYVADISTDIGQYTQCLVRQHECRVEDLLVIEAPRAATLIGSVDFAALGLSPPAQFPHDFCPTPSPTP